MKDRLFLLKPGFFSDGRGPLYCSDSLPLEGLLGLYPALREAIDVVHVEFPRPRAPLVAVLGEAHQSAPVLVLADRATAAEGIAVKTAAGLHFIDHETDIRAYLSRRYELADAS